MVQTRHSLPHVLTIHAASDLLAEATANAAKGPLFQPRSYPFARLDEDGSQSFGAQLLVNAQEVDFSHLDHFVEDLLARMLCRLPK